MNKTIKLNSGLEMPLIGMGTWKSEPNKVGEAVKYALLEAGYKHIDGAAIYRNEPEVGEAYEEVFKTVNREDIFITSKLWNTNHNPKYVEEACRQTLKDLKLEYLDLYLMHWGVAFAHGGELEPMKDGKVVTENISIKETWQAMEKLVELKLVKSIGVANFTRSQLDSLLSYAEIKPAVNQIEMHPYLSQVELLKYCNSKGIVVTAYSPLGRLGVTTYEVPRLHNEPIIQVLAKKYNKSVAQVLLNWGLLRGTVVIPKSVTPERIKENIGAYDFALTRDDIKQIDTLNKNFRFVDPSSDWGYDYFNQK
ncbi:aldo/keto reductase [Candidatus Woesebacteria bacterium]|nr:aldo/keto reductase [Candidatus Woesebacteria bacterium]